MYNLVISLEQNDIELKDELIKTFGEKLQFQNVKNFDGLGFFLTVVVPISGLTVQIVDFIVTHFTKKGSGQKELPKRVLISKDGTIDLKNYDAKEVSMILESYFENQKKR